MENPCGENKPNNYEIRIYKERFNISYDYYTGYKDIQKRIYTSTKRKLILEWNQALKKYEGETYSVWDGENIIVGGAFDPSDIDTIKEYFGDTPKWLITEKELREMVIFGISHPNTEFYTEQMNDGEDFLSCTFFNKDDDNESGFWELNKAKKRGRMAW